jgi:hypothetical protein
MISVTQLSIILLLLLLNKVLSRALTSSAGLLKQVAVFLLFFATIFALIGTQFFSGSLARRCVIEVPMDSGMMQDVVVYPRQACGSYYDVAGILRPAVNGTRIKGYACPQGQICKPVDYTDERPIGFLSFDSFLMSLFAVFVTSTEQGWSDTMYMTIDSEMTASIMFHVLIVVVVEMV